MLSVPTDCCLRECVQCRAFNKGEKKDTCAQECSHFNLTKVESRDKLPQPVQVDPVTHCKEKDIDDCWFYFTYSVNGNNEAIVHVVETPGRQRLGDAVFLCSDIRNSLGSYCLSLCWETFLSKLKVELA